MQTVDITDDFIKEHDDMIKGQNMSIKNFELNAIQQTQNKNLLNML